MSVTTRIMFSSRPRVAPTYSPWQVVAPVARVMDAVVGFGLVAGFGGRVAELDVLAT